MTLKRILRVYLIIGKTFNVWITPIFTGLLITLLRMIVGIARILDHIIFPKIGNHLKEPIIIVGNPRSGTTFLHRFLIKQGFGVGSQLWQNSLHTTDKAQNIDLEVCFKSLWLKPFAWA